MMMMRQLYHALKEAGVSEDSATKAAEEMANLVGGETPGLRRLEDRVKSLEDKVIDLGLRLARLEALVQYSVRLQYIMLGALAALFIRSFLA